MPPPYRVGRKVPAEDVVFISTLQNRLRAGAGIGYHGSWLHVGTAGL